MLGIRLLPLFIWKALPTFLQSCVVVPFILNPQNCVHSPLTQGVGWVYFLLELFTCTLELTGRRSLKSISKQLFPLPFGANPVVSTSVLAALLG